MRLISLIPNVSFSHVYRDRNTAADALANHAASGVTVEVWMVDLPPPPPAPRSGRSPRPDMATCLLGVRPHRASAAVEMPVDWLQTLRLSTILHLYKTLNDAWRHDVHASSAEIRSLIANDFVRAIWSRWKAKLGCGVLRNAAVLKNTAGDFKTASLRDFADIAGW
jgi:hypothetical protein